MKTIKFRAWDGKKMWVDYKTYLLLDIATGKVFNTVEDRYMPKDAYQLMQFTGLHDKNGKEIYEGDIVETSSGNKYIVEFSNGVFGVLTKYYGRRALYEFIKIKVIDNIYENPELLEKD
jgi:uncharacterized phage protein (TIGR01671 family)